MHAPKTPLPAAGRFDRHIAYGAPGAAALALVLLITFFVCRRRSFRHPTPIREYTIVHTPWSRLRNMAWAVATTVACLLVKRALDIAHQGDTTIVQVIRAVLEALLPPRAAGRQVRLALAVEVQEIRPPRRAPPHTHHLTH